MLSIQQCLISALLQNATYIEVSHKSAILIDYMSATNQCFSDVALYIDNLQKLENSLEEVVAKFLEGYEAAGYAKGDEDAFFYKMINSIYGRLLQDNVMFATSMQLITDQQPAPYRSVYSNSVISRVPGVATLDINPVGLAVGDINFTDEVSDCEEFGEFMNAFMDISTDPSYGNGRYGRMPYLFPQVTEPYRAVRPDNDLHGYIRSIWQAYRSVVEYMDAKDEFRKTEEQAQIENLDDDTKEYVTRTHSELTKIMKSHLHTIVLHLYNAFMDIPYSYNSRLKHIPPFKTYKG